MPSARLLLDERIARHRADLLAFVRRRVRRDAEEIAQETWVRVVRADPDCPDEASFRAYAYTVARRLIIDHVRSSARALPLVPLEGGMHPQPASSGDPAQMMQAGQALAVVQEELRHMKPEIAEVFRLRMTTGLSFKEIAARQGCSLNTALGRHHQATRRLARVLRAKGLGPEDPDGM